MELMQALATRRSVRAYTPQPVDRTVVEQLIGAATLAPSGMNLQPWAFAVVEGVEKLRDLSDRVKHSLLTKLEHSPSLSRYRDRLTDPAYNVFYDAPTLVLVCAKPSTYDPTAGCVMAAYTFMLAARDRGLGTCWIGFADELFRRPDTKAEFGIPAEYRVVAPLIIGYPDGETDPSTRHPPEILAWR